MYIIIGASGQVGSAIVKNLLAAQQQVKAVVHSPDKATKLKEQGASVAIADGFDLASLKNAVKGGDTLFVITPETGKSTDLIKETQQLLNNYREAIKGTSIKKVIGLSSMGAHLGTGTGNLEMSYMLEHAFEGLNIDQAFIRPAYYFSNWLIGLEQIKTTGTLPTFFPPDMAIPMISPQDVASFAADIMTRKDTGKLIYELEGPAGYSSNDVAKALGTALNQKVNTQQIQEQDWPAALKKMGFTEDGTKNFIKMTQLVIEGEAVAEETGTFLLKGDTTLQQFINEALK